LCVAQIGSAPRIAGLGPDTGQAHQDHRGQQPDDCNDHQELNKGKTSAANGPSFYSFHHMKSFEVILFFYF
jgi:hypothetical protein